VDASSTAPLCRACGATSRFFLEERRTYFTCPSCTFIFTNQVLSKNLQVMHYTKQWNLQDASFYQNLASIILEMANVFHKPEKILDFGSGPGRLADELASRGYQVTAVEPMVHGYLKDQPKDIFDTVICIEVIEHLLNLEEEFKEIDSRLKPGGVIIISTVLYNPFAHANPEEEFKKYWYKDDPTHVNFFDFKSAEAFSRKTGYTIRLFGPTYFALQKPK
jgi:SAM-dependent methyltransferase